MAAAVNPPTMEGLNGSDPFGPSSNDVHRQRYAAFDDSQFSLYLHGSREQAKRALKAHHAETTRRLQETSTYGNALVQQKKELEDKMQELNQQESEDDIGPELRSRLAELEKEFNDVGRETARAFLPKSRATSGETDTHGGSIYSGEVQHSPTKVSVPSRKQRNQQPSRINDIALATEISTSLLEQLRGLQAVLVERDEALKAADLDRSQLEIEVEGLSQRLRTLDESESRLKDVNWNLETQVRESDAQSKAAAEKEHRLNLALNLARTEKSTLEREVEELKGLYSKLNDDHINKSKQSETELTSLRRNVAMGETERSAMQRKVEELTNQNQELARAVAYRMKADDHIATEDTSPDEEGEDGGVRTPDHSPPPSPSKATPRHGMLESETLKHSLQHAHRMIQQLKNNIHREKTEKIELKRMLQDARDELETNRSAAPGSAGKRRKNDKDVFKKPARPDRLGALRSGTQEILVDDEEWEEQEGMPGTPSRPLRSMNSLPGAFTSDFSSAAETSANEGFETANDTSDAAFETANERDGMTTESDAFQTGAETLDGDSSDQLTETEAGPSQTIRRSKSSIAKDNHQDSYESTASISGDEYNDNDIRTPIQNQHSRFRLRAKQSGSRRSTPRGNFDLVPGSSPFARDSPASVLSYKSNNSTPAQGKSLFAELEGLSGDEDDGSFVDGTPSRSSILQSAGSSPAASMKSVLAASPLPKPAMVDSSTMTDREVIPSSQMSSIWSQNTVPQAVHVPSLNVSALATHDTSPYLPKQPSFQLSTVTGHDTAPRLVLPPSLNISDVSGHGTTPQIPSLPIMGMSSFSSQGTTPQSPVKPQFSLSHVTGQDTTPQNVPIAPLNISSLSINTTEPRDVAIPALAFSATSGHGTEPREVVAPTLGFSSTSGHATEPRDVATPALGFSSTSGHGTEPVAPNADALNVSTIAHQITDPVEGSSLKSLAPALLTASALSSQTTEPEEKMARSVSNEDKLSGTGEKRQNVTRAALQMSDLSARGTDPKDVPAPMRPTLSTMSSQATEPLAPKNYISQFSTMSSQATEPLAPKGYTSQFSAISSHGTQPVVPQQPRLNIAMLSPQTTEPIVPKPGPPQLSSLSFQESKPKSPFVSPPTLSLMSSQATEPKEPVKTSPSQISVQSFQATSPIEPPRRPLPQVSSICTQQTEPVAVPGPIIAQHRMSDVRTLHDAQPESPTVPAFLPTPASRPSTAHRVLAPFLHFSQIFSQNTEPSEPSRPITATKTGPVPFSASATSSGTMTDGSTQTMVSAEQIDKLLLARSQQRQSGTIVTAGIDKVASPPVSPSRRSFNEAGRSIRRPGSAGSNRSRAGTPPPLPPDHKEVIAAAALKPMPPIGTMGPPTMPASAYKKQRPQTPTIKTNATVSSPKTGGTKSRPRRQSHRSGASSPISRRSSLSSFTSEVDQRFNIPGDPTFTPSGMPAGATDPRMIQAITQTMIGEYLWKYTRKAGRDGLSENRHRRFFWIHPYTRTLYWSDTDPQSAGKNESKAKSVAIEDVAEVEDTNPLPPGLHQMSLVVKTRGRSIKFTATTSQRHETWLNALQYLCQRVDDGAQKPQEQEPKVAVSDEIQDEFNGGYRSTSRQTGRSRASLSSYVSRHGSQNHNEVPTLRQSTIGQSRTISTETVPSSVSSRLSSFIRPSGTMRASFSRRQSKSSVQESPTISEPSSANMDLSNDIHEHMERDFDGMANVRACCDGKHDVGHLHHVSLKGRHNTKNGQSRPSLIGSMSSRTQSRTQSRSQSRTESYGDPRSESRNSRIRHQTEMEAANYGAGS